MDDEFLTLQEFADKVRLCRQTVVKMINAGKICCLQSSDEKGRYRIKASEVNRPISWKMNKKQIEKEKNENELK